MSRPALLTWHDANQRHLTAALVTVREALERHAGKDEAAPERPRHEQLGAFEPPPALETLCAAFGLSTFERGVLLMCAGIELDSAFAACCAEAQGDAGQPYPTFGLALAALPDAHWSALSPASPLRRWRLVEVNYFRYNVRRNPTTDGPVRVTSR